MSLKKLITTYKFEFGIACVLLVRMIFIFLTWYHARESYVITIVEGNEAVKTGIFSVLVFIIQIITTFLIEIGFTINFERSRFKELIILPIRTLKRLLIFECLLLLAELSLYVNLILELNGQASFSFVQNLAAGASYLSIYQNPSSYPVYWIALGSYMLAMVYILIPRRNDPTQIQIELSALLLLIRSIFLPF